MIPCQEEGKLYILSVANPQHVALVQTADSAVGTRTGAWDEQNDRGYYMAGQSTGKRVHGHLVLQPGHVGTAGDRQVGRASIRAILPRARWPGSNCVGTQQGALGVERSDRLASIA